MKGIDTNILVRFLVGDDETQARKVYDLFKKAEAARSELFVPLLVILELIWVLESVYAIPRHEILDALRELLLMPVLNFEHRPVLHHFIQAAQESKYDLSDLLIAHAAKAQGCEVVMTFDRKAARFALFELVR
ncbi:MAG: putative nucleic-acid-binding protein, contains PIN domain [Candidatus Electronema aureum]|uniref:Ribonuclease VapC n=1 Tax=Candidatus Electronema aureum TaxID=2005002 RepID=A0A521FZB0_9BACT|nr:MAG: putative nucleic-acid-binding protein, contains PIN domain [Candidatus Electronema aureum]